MRSKKPIIIIDAYYDGDGYALCPAATGFTHHISPWGDIEPCPVIQIAKDSIYDQRPLKEVLGQSAFLRDFRETAATYTRGCIVLERPDLLLALAEKHGAKDTTVRQTAFEEIRSMRRGRRNSIPATKCPRRTGSIACSSGCGSTTTAPMPNIFAAKIGKTRDHSTRRMARRAPAGSDDAVTESRGRRPHWLSTPDYERRG